MLALKVRGVVPSRNQMWEERRRVFQQSLVTGEVPAKGLQVLDPGGPLRALLSFNESIHIEGVSQVTQW